MSGLETIWFTRCPVPTATGLAYKLGWLNKSSSRTASPSRRCRRWGASWPAITTITSLPA